MQLRKSVLRDIWILSFCLAGTVVSADRVCADDIQQITLNTNDLIYDPGTQEIYASVPSAAGSNGNSITPINPETGAVGSSVFIGSEPGQLARSDDNQFLYVALNGSSSVRRFNLAAQTAGLQFSIGTPLQVEDMAVPPGQPNSVCIVREDPRYSPHFAGTAIYDDGVARADTSNGQDTIAFSASPWRLFAYNNSISQFDFDRLNISATGFDAPGSDSDSNLISGYGLRIKFSDGLIFVNNGEVIDPEAETILGTFSGTGYGGPFAVQPGDGRAFFLTGSGSTLTLCAYDTTTFLPTGTLDITGVSGSPGSLIRWGSNGIAFRTSGNQVFLIRTSLVPSKPSWSAAAIAVDPEGNTRPLWDSVDGRTSVWTINSSDGVTSTPIFQPGSEWSSKDVSVDGAGNSHILWTNPDGRATVWTVDGRGNATSLPIYQPGGGWSAQALSVDDGGTAHVLWENPDGRAAVWAISPAGQVASTPIYDPGDGWSAKNVSEDDQGNTHLLWTNADGRMSVWTIDGLDNVTSSPIYQPGGGWSAKRVSMDAQGNAHVLWSNLDGRMAVWGIAPGGSVFSLPILQAGAGWSAQGLAMDGAGDARVLWENSDGRTAVWSISPAGQVSSTPIYQP